MAKQNSGFLKQEVKSHLHFEPLDDTIKKNQQLESTSLSFRHVCLVLVFIPLLNSFFPNCMPHSFLPPFIKLLFQVHAVSMWGNQWHLCNLCHLLPSHCQVLLVPVSSPVSPVERVKMRVSRQVGNRSMKSVADGLWDILL